MIISSAEVFFMGVVVIVVCSCGSIISCGSVFCSLVLDYLAPHFPNLFHFSPLTLAPLHPLASPLDWHFASCTSWWRIENSTKLMLVCLIGYSIESIPVTFFKHVERIVSLCSKVMSYRSYLLTTY